jgi:deoxyribodipyrimidine photo-lyase
MNVKQIAQMQDNETLDRLQTDSVTLFWFRRDLRLYDNAGLYEALKQNENILPVFIFDPQILSQLETADLRVPFIHKTVLALKQKLVLQKSDLWIDYGTPLQIFQKLAKKFKVQAIYLNHDYEPQAVLRDQSVETWAKSQNIEFKTFKDHVIFEKNEILTDAGKPYTVYTPYKKKWLASLSAFYLKSYPIDLYEHHFMKIKVTESVPTLEIMNFKTTQHIYPETNVSVKILKNYAEKRDFPALDQTSKLGLHLRFGTVSPRELAREGKKYSEVWLSELIWRDFFTQILFHFPHVVKGSFRPEYDQIQWLDDEITFTKWKNGETGYPLVDAGMRELNATGHMHNRVRMVVASFLTKHLLTHWLKGERYFAEKLLDYDLSANNGNWQWAAGTGCDAAPYFRVFNPTTQLEKFDPKLEYVKKWVPEYGTSKYCAEIVDHVFARNRALTEYKKGLGK